MDKPTETTQEKSTGINSTLDDLLACLSSRELFKKHHADVRTFCVRYVSFDQNPIQDFSQPNADKSCLKAIGEKIKALHDEIQQPVLSLELEFQHRWTIEHWEISEILDAPLVQTKDTSTVKVVERNLSKRYQTRFQRKVCKTSQTKSNTTCNGFRNRTLQIKYTRRIAPHGVYCLKWLPFLVIIIAFVIAFVCGK